MSSSMSIDEVDDILALGETPSKTLSYIVLCFMILFWVSGGFIISLFLWGSRTAITGALGRILGFMLEWKTMVIIGVIFIVMLLAAFLYLYLIYKFARELLMALYVLLGVGLLGFGVFLIYLDPNLMVAGAIFAIIGLIVLILFLVFRERISLAGRMIELSAKSVWDEKGTMSLIIVKALLIAWTVITWIISLFFWTIMTYAALEGSQYQGVITLATGLLLFFAGLWVLIFLDTFFSAAIVRIIHDWYRSPEVDVASVRKGIGKAWEVSGSLAKYALIFAILSFIIYLARSYSRRGRGRGAIAARIVAWVTGFTHDVLKFLGFYMIPAMVIRKAGFKTAFKDSVNKLRDLFIETIAGMFGFEIVLGFLAFITAGSMGIIGYFIGYYVFSPIVGINMDPTTVGLISGIGLFVLSLIPIGLATSAVSVAWKTILYEYGLDVEFASRGIALPSRLPEDIKMKFAEVLEERRVPVSPVATA